MNEARNKAKFADIFQNDDFGLLDVIDTPRTQTREEDWRLVEQFNEITQFYRDNNRLPSSSSPDIYEFTLASRLSGILGNNKRVIALRQHDTFGLLDVPTMDDESLRDLLLNDPFDLLVEDSEGDSIHRLSHVKPSERLRPDYIAHRKVCKDFSVYQESFDRIHAEIEKGTRKLVAFNEDSLIEGRFFVLRGVMFYLAENKSTFQEFQYKDRVYNRKDGRTRCIFSNGTESTMLYRSLVKAMSIDGFSVSDTRELNGRSNSIDPDDVQNGFIYVLRSLSRIPEIRQMRNLYKIGYSNGDVANRVKNAQKDPTYLMSDVQVVLTAICFNVDVHYIESSVHRFFDNCKVNLSIVDDNGVNHSPREWFSVPLLVVEEAIRLIINKEVDQYEYDHNINQIIRLA